MLKIRIKTPFLVIIGIIAAFNGQKMGEIVTFQGCQKYKITNLEQNNDTDVLKLFR